MRLHKGDTIEIVTGKDRGRQGPVEKVLRKDDKVKVVVGGLNLAIKHRKRTQQGRQGQTGGRIEMPMPIDVSNVMLVCPKCSLKTRIGFQIEGEKKVRVCKKCWKGI